MLWLLIDIKDKKKIFPSFVSATNCFFVVWVRSMPMYISYHINLVCLFIFSSATRCHSLMNCRHWAHLGLTWRIMHIWPLRHLALWMFGPSDVWLLLDLACCYGRTGPLWCGCHNAAVSPYYVWGVQGVAIPSSPLHSPN